MVVLEEAENRNHATRGNQDLQLVPCRDLNFLHKLRHALGHVLTEVGQILARHRVELSHGGTGFKSCCRVRAFFPENKKKK